MIIQHDIIDRRKVTTVAKAPASASFSDGLELGLRMKMQAFDQQYGDGEPGTCQRHFMAPLLAYFYRGVRPAYYMSDNPADVAAAQMIEAVATSPLLGQHKKLAKHNIWSADVVTAVVANLILPEPPPDPEGDGAPPPPQEGEDPNEQPEGGSGEGEGEGEEDPQDGEGEGQGDPGDQDEQQPGDQPEGDGGEGEENEGDDPSSGASGGGADDIQRDLVTAATTARGGDEDVAWHDFQKRIERKLEDANKTLRETEATTMEQVGSDGNYGKGEKKAVTLTDLMEKMQGQQQKLEISPFVASSQWGNGLYMEAQRVNDLMGRLQSTLTGAMADRVKYAPSTPVKLTVGNNLSLALKHQFVHLDQPTEVLLQKQWLGHELMQREVTGIIRAGKGPIIMCIDVSGSMFGMQMEWAMALAGALGWAAAKRKREVAYVYYSNTVPDILHIPSKLRNDHKALDEAIGTVVHNIGIGNKQWHPYSMMETLAEKGITHRDGTPFERMRNGGGTVYWTALEAALGVMLSNKSWRNADVLFLSDGGDSDAANAPTARGALAHSKLSTKAKGPKRNVAVGRGGTKGGMIGRSFVQELNALGARVYGIGLVESQPGDEQRAKDNAKEMFSRSMHYFDSYVIAAINENTNAEDVLRIIGRNL